MENQKEKLDISGHIQVIRYSKKISKKREFEKREKLSKKKLLLIKSHEPIQIIV